MTVWQCIFGAQNLFYFTDINTITAPYSYPTVEVHIHSGRALISALLSSLSALPTLRLADPGEFTHQALLGGQLDGLDLTQVEGLHDLVEANTEVQRVWVLDSVAVSIFLLFLKKGAFFI